MPRAADIKPQPRLSVFIITRDEGDRIERCIRSIKDIADEVVVVDSGSTDDTVAKAEALGAKVFFRAWDGFGPQKRFAEEKLTHDWVLNLDADEEATEALRKEIVALLSTEPPLAAYRLRLVTVYPGRDRPRLWADDHNAVRLYDKRKIRYRDSLVHDRPETGDHAVGQLKAPALHFSARSLAHMRAKYESYTDLQALEIKKPRWQLVARLPFEYPFSFFRSYVTRRNFTGGFDGLKVAHIFAAMRTRRLVKMLRRLEAEHPTRFTWVHILASLAAGFVALLLAATYVWRDDIHQAFLDPGVPFVTHKPPPAPDYANAAAWALIPAKPTTWTPADPAADVFFIHPTTYDGGREWNGPVGDPKADRLLGRVMLPNHAGPFRTVGRLFAPRYRQASLYSHLTSREDAREARTFAYDDVREAFRLYRRQYNRGRPLVVVGVEQGGFLAQRLVRDEVMTDPELAGRLAAVYLIETAVPEGFAPLPTCASRAQPGCVAAWIGAMQGEDDRIRDRLRRSLVWRGDRPELLNGRRPICVNPLTGAHDSAATARDNLGGANASRLEWGVTPPFLPRQVSASCLEGVLRIGKAKSSSLRRKGGWADRERARPFNVFYKDIEVDANARVASLLSRPGFGRLAPPIDKVIDIKPARGFY